MAPPPKAAPASGQDGPWLGWPLASGWPLCGAAQAIAPSVHTLRGPGRAPWARSPTPRRQPRTPCQPLVRMAPG
eukprot:scaffold117765_cov51-Phaeocystis_antarctica.AAC.2